MCVADCAARVLDYVISMTYGARTCGTQDAIPRNYGNDDGDEFEADNHHHGERDHDDSLIFWLHIHANPNDDWRGLQMRLVDLRSPVKACHEAAFFDQLHGLPRIRA